MPYDVVHRHPRFDLANVSYVHHSPAGDPGPAGNLAFLTRLSLVSFGKVRAGEAGVQGSPRSTAFAFESSFVFAV